jgi:TatD DNase family protein
VLGAATEAGVELIVTVGMDVATSARGVAVSESADMVFAAVGLHPWMAQDHPDGAPVDEIEALAMSDQVVAIGEIGLDFVDNSWRELSYRDDRFRSHQEAVFREQVRLARRLGLPVILHSRGAHETTTRILEEEGAGAVGGCVQFFEGTTEDVRAYLALDFAFSLGSSVTFPDPGHWYDVVRAIPSSALLLETDAPWLPFCGSTSDRGTPADLAVIGEAVAQVRREDPAGLFAYTARNAKRVFPGVRAGAWPAR